MGCLSGLLLVLSLNGCKKNYADVPKDQDNMALLQKKSVERGQYLVASIGCMDCHSPKKMGPQGFEELPGLHLSGFPGDRPIPEPVPEALEKGWILMNHDLTAAAGPWGISFASNLTSDETGIGNWNYEQFERAIRQGKYKGMENGRMLLPPMPWQNFANLSDEDLRAIFDYLKSTKPVKNAVPAPVPPAQAGEQTASLE